MCDRPPPAEISSGRCRGPLDFCVSFPSFADPLPFEVFIPERRGSWPFRSWVACFNLPVNPEARRPPLPLHAEITP